ncbi:MAG: hypothetical protein ABIP48_01080 [Planctomycetota bacterium]
MTRRDHRNGLDQVAQQMPTPEGGWQEILELLAEHGFDGMAQALEMLFNEAMKLERSVVLEAQPCERTPARREYRTISAKGDVIARPPRVANVPALVALMPVSIPSAKASRVSAPSSNRRHGYSARISSAVYLGRFLTRPAIR